MRLARGLLSIAAFAAVLAGCGRTVAVTPLPISSEDTRQACAELVAAMPQRISAGRSWSVSPDPESTLAWGSPSVVLRCGDGVPIPAPTDQLLSIDGLDWLITPLTDGEQYSTVGRAPGVIVSVPDRYSPTAAVVTEVSGAVWSHTGPAPG